MSKEMYLARATHPSLDEYVNLGLVEGDTYEDAWLEAYKRALQSDCEADSVELAYFDGTRTYKIDWSFTIKLNNKRGIVHRSNVVKAGCVQEAIRKVYAEEVGTQLFITCDQVSIWNPFNKSFDPIFDDEAEED